MGIGNCCTCTKDKLQQDDEKSDKSELNSIMRFGDVIIRF